MSKKNKIVKRLLVFALSVAIIFAFTPLSLLSYAEEENADDVPAVTEPVSEQVVQKEDLQQPADLDEGETPSKEELKPEGVEPEEALKGGTKYGEVEEEDAICRIGDKYYNDLWLAVYSIYQDNIIDATIVLLDDIVVNYTSISLFDGTNVTITDDGNKRTIKRNDNLEFTTPLFSVPKNSTLTFDGTANDNLCLEGGVQPSRDANGTVVRNGASIATVKGKLELKHATISGGTINGGNRRGAISVSDGGTFDMSGGIIKDTSFEDCYVSAPVLVSSVKASKSSTFEMSGGKIMNNTNHVVNPTSRGTMCAGAVTLEAWYDNDPNSVMNMSGGSIEGNSSYHGGGVYMGGKSEMHMTGGEIKNNIANGGNGGGVCVSGITQSNPVVGWYDTNEFTMDGGTISGNQANNGGGIYVNSDAVYLNEGVIENNIAKVAGAEWTGHGGGVYVSEVPRVLHISNAVITENKAIAASKGGAKASTAVSYMGGGLWACPTGSVDLQVTEGVAVFGNSAVGNMAAGDDIVKVDYKDEGIVTIADRMLGGGKVDWYQDGAVKGSKVGYVDTDVPRYDASNPGEPLHFKNEENSIAAKAVVSDAAIQRANEEAKLFIRGNVAAHGGGIGTNGDLTLRDNDTEEWTLMAQKEWIDVPEEEQKEIEVFLKIDDEILDSVKLNAENDWTASFEHLPAPSSLTNPNITVVEGYYVTENGEKIFKETEEYLVDYERTVSEADATIWVTVKNSSRFVEEQTTTTRPTTTEPDTDTTTTTPSQVSETTTSPGQTSQPTTKKPGSGSSTGDSSHMAFAYWLLLLSGCAGVMAVMYRRKKTQ